MTATNANLFAALVAAQTSCEAVAKGSKSGQGYKYASAEAMIGEARAGLNSSGLALLRTRSTVAWGDLSADGKTRVGSVTCTYLLVHTSGESIELESETPAITQPGRPDDKAVATALTYALGYFLRDLLLLPRVEAGTDVDQRDDSAHAPSPAPRFSPPSAKKTAPKATVESAETFLAAIAAASTTDRLTEVAARVAHAGLAAGDLERIKAAGIKRRAELSSDVLYPEPGSDG